MIVPDWMKGVLTAFDSKTEPHSEDDVAGALEAAAKAHGDPNEEDKKAYLAEYSAFMLVKALKNTESHWGTYFGPKWVWSNADVLPDIKLLDAETVHHWQTRAQESNNPLMAARYADASWDLARAIADLKPNHEMARLAIDSYISAADRQLCSIPFFAVDWLVRALELSRSIRDDDKAKRVTGAMFSLYKANLSPKLFGVWLRLADHLYEARDLLPQGSLQILISDLETMLRRFTVQDENNEFSAFNAQSIGETLVRHHKKVGDNDSVVRVVKTFGSAFEKMADGGSAMQASGWLQPVVERYEQEGLKTEAEGLLNKLEGLYARAQNEMHTHSFTIEITKEELDDLANLLIAEDDLRLTLNRTAVYFLPKVNQARKTIGDKNAIAPLMSIIPVEIIDHTGLPKARIGTDEDEEGRLYYELCQTMSFDELLLHLILEKIKGQFALNADNLVSYLYESPIFLESRKPILREGLVAYLQRDFLKAIHVLVPQVEEALRNFLVLLSIPPVKTVSRHPGINDVKSMNNILEEERVRQVLPEDVWRYLTMLYIDRRGINLRNDLAHGLIPLEGFNEYVANRVLHSLLILAPIRATNPNGT